jgi:hypothetical protein
MTGMAGRIGESLAVQLLGWVQTNQLVPNILIAPATHTGTRSIDRGRPSRPSAGKQGTT